MGSANTLAASSMTRVLTGTSSVRPSWAAQFLQYGRDSCFRDGARKAHHDAVDHAVAPIPDLDRHLVDWGDDRELLKDLVVDERAHGVPIALPRQTVQLVVQPAPAVKLQNLAVGGSRAVEGDLLAGADGGGAQSGFVFCSHHEHRTRHLKVAAPPARPVHSAQQCGSGHFLEVAP